MPFYFVPDIRHQDCVSWALAVLRRRISAIVAQIIKSLPTGVSKGSTREQHGTHGCEVMRSEVFIEEEVIRRWSEFNRVCYFQRRERGEPPLVVLSVSDVLKALGDHYRRVSFDREEESSLSRSPVCQKRGYDDAVIFALEVALTVLKS